VKRVLFVCTGNYYRSRFAESLFNAMASERGLPWQADSRGTDVVNAGRWNVGPLSQFARHGLQERGVRIGDDVRVPLQLGETDLTHADLIIGISEVEHRPHLQRDFPAWCDRVEYWTVEDLGITPADEALTALHRYVDELIARLEQAQPADGGRGTSQELRPPS
jgi:protein-tyrosine phosphatase